MTKLSDNIKRLRAERGYTLEELGKKIGTSKQNVSRYESGSIPQIPYEKISALAKVFGVTPGYLMGWEDNLESSNASRLAAASTDDKLLKHIEVLSGMSERGRECVYEIAEIISRAKVF